jgi:ABC-type phosphate transport system substrate-binding protein
MPQPPNQSGKLNMNSLLMKISLFTALLVVGAIRAPALDGVEVIANLSVVPDCLSADKLKDIYTARTKYWDNGQAIIIVVLPDQTHAALEQASGMDGSHLKTFWQRLAFSGRGSEPEKVGNPAELVAYVAATKGAIAIAPADAVLEGVKQIEIK